MGTVIGFVDLLSAQAEAIGGRRNGPHTRLRIQIATARLLQEFGYDKLSIGAICEKVSLTRPGFYLHYRNKEELVIDLLQELATTEEQLMPSMTNCADLYEAVEKICNWYFRFHLHSEGLFSTLAEMRRSVPAARAIQAARSESLHKTISYQLNRFDAYRAIDPGWAAFSVDATARAMGVTASSVNRQAGPAPMHYSNDIGRLVGMFTRMMYSTLTSEQMPNARSNDAQNAGKQRTLPNLES